MRKTVTCITSPPAPDAHTLPVEFTNPTETANMFRNDTTGTLTLTKIIAAATLAAFILSVCA